MSDRLPQLALTGPRGCVGRAMAAFLAREHPEVRVVPVGTLPFSYEMTLRPLLVDGAITHFVNCASLGSNSESIADPLGYYATNSIGVLHQLEAIRKLSPHTRYVNLGTIYEASSDSAATPPYPSSKRIARELVTTYREQYGLHASTATLGFTEYYGRHESFLSRRIAMGVARKTRAVRLEEDGEPLVLHDIDSEYCWTWAEDVAAGLWLTLEDHHPYDRYLTSGDPHTVREFVDQAFKVAGLDAAEWIREPSGEERLIVPRRAILAVASGNAERLAIDEGAARRRLTLGWSPHTTFPQLVERMVQYDIELLDNPRPAPKWPA